MQDRKVFITGATSGIGEATALRFAEAGASLILTGRRAERLHQVAANCRASGAIEVLPLAFDLASRSETEGALKHHQGALKDLDLLINNAGLALGKSSFQEALLDDLETMISTNVTGLIRITHLILPFIKKQSGAAIVNIGSVAGRWSYPGGHVYNATKFAVRGFSEALRIDLMPDRIRVINIEPGRVQTEFSEVRFKGDKTKASLEYNSIDPLTADDIAKAIFWCASQPPHVNIQELVVFPTDQGSVVHFNQKP